MAQHLNNPATRISPFIVQPAHHERSRRRFPFSLSPLRLGSGAIWTWLRTGLSQRVRYFGMGMFKGRDRCENRRKARLGRCQRGWYVSAALVAVGLGGAMDASWSALTRYVMHHPYFTVQEIVVNSNGRFSAEEVRTWGGLVLGRSLWKIDPAQVEARLRAQPWIETAQVRREFPQRVYVTVKTRRPVAIVLQDSLLYLDDTGTCFAGQGKSEVLDLPYVSGLTGLSLDTPTARTALTGVLHLLSLARLWQEPLSEVHWDPQQGYTVFLARLRVTIRLGWTTTPEKFAQVGAVLATWPIDGPAALFDARFADQVVVRPSADERDPRAHDLSRPL